MEEKDIDVNFLKRLNLYAQESKRHSWVSLSITLALLGFVFFLFLTFGFIQINIIGSLLLALLMVRLFVIYHDYHHGSILKKSRPGKFLMWILGQFLITPGKTWKESHDYHHRKNSKLENSHIGAFRTLTPMQFDKLNFLTKKAYLFYHSFLFILNSYFFVFIFGMCLGPFLYKPFKYWEGATALLFHIIGSILFFHYLGWQNFLFLWFLPFYLSAATGVLVFYLQHNFPQAQYQESEEWTSIRAAILSTSHLVMNPITTWFTGNIGYHHIHHLNAKIPFYRLPEVSKTFNELKSSKKVQFNLKNIWISMRLKFWDPRLKKMISFSEYRQMEIQR